MDNKAKQARAAKMVEAEDWDAVRQKLEARLQEEPEDLETLVSLGLVLQYQKDYEGARDLFERALKLEPTNPAILNGLGVVCAHLGEFEQARTWLEQALAIDGDQNDTLKNLAQVCLLCEDYQKAVETYQELLQRYPTDVETLMEVAGLYASVSDLDSARLLLQRALELEPEHRFAREALQDVETALTRPQPESAPGSEPTSKVEVKRSEA